MRNRSLTVPNGRGSVKCACRAARGSKRLGPGLRACATMLCREVLARFLRAESCPPIAESSLQHGPQRLPSMAHGELPVVTRLTERTSYLRAEE